MKLKINDIKDGKNTDAKKGKRFFKKALGLVERLYDKSKKALLIGTALLTITFSPMNVNANEENTNSAWTIKDIEKVWVQEYEPSSMLSGKFCWEGKNVEYEIPGWGRKRENVYGFKLSPYTYVTVGDGKITIYVYFYMNQILQLPGVNEDKYSDGFVGLHMEGLGYIYNTISFKGDLFKLDGEEDYKKIKLLQEKRTEETKNFCLPNYIKCLYDNIPPKCFFDREVLQNEFEEKMSYLKKGIKPSSGMTTTDCTFGGTDLYLIAYPNNDIISIRCTKHTNKNRILPDCEFESIMISTENGSSYKININEKIKDKIIKEEGYTIKFPPLRLGLYKGSAWGSNILFIDDIEKNYTYLGDKFIGSIRFNLLVVIENFYSGRSIDIEKTKEECEKKPNLPYGEINYNFLPYEINDPFLEFLKSNNK